MDMETIEKWLPYYKKSGALLNNVPEEFVPEIVRKCEAHGLKCDISSLGDGLCLVHVKGDGQA
jgi:hypothetical protein